MENSLFVEVNEVDIFGKKNRKLNELLIQFKETGYAVARVNFDKLGYKSAKSFACCISIAIKLNPQLNCNYFRRKDIVCLVNKSILEGQR